MGCEKHQGGSKAGAASMDPHSTLTPQRLLAGGFPSGSAGKNPFAMQEIKGHRLIPGWGRSTREGNGNPRQYSCLENSMDGGAWQVTVHGVAKSQTRLK